MRKLINSAFLLLLTLFVMGKSWATCPNYNPNQLTSDDFLINNNQEIDTSYFIMKGVLQTQNLQYVANVTLPLICDGTMHDNNFMYYKCIEQLRDSQFYPKVGNKMLNKLKTYHTFITNINVNYTKFVYGDIPNGNVYISHNNCEMHIIDANNKIIYNLEIASTGNKK